MRTVPRNAKELRDGARKDRSIMNPPEDHAPPIRLPRVVPTLFIIVASYLINLQNLTSIKTKIVVSGVINGLFYGVIIKSNFYYVRIPIQKIFNGVSYLLSFIPNPDPGTVRQYLFLSVYLSLAVIGITFEKEFVKLQAQFQRDFTIDRITVFVASALVVGLFIRIFVELLTFAICDGAKAFLSCYASALAILWLMKKIIIIIFKIIRKALRIISAGVCGVTSIIRPHLPRILAISVYLLVLFAGLHFRIEIERPEDWRRLGFIPTIQPPSSPSQAVTPADHYLLDIDRTVWREMLHGLALRRDSRRFITIQRIMPTAEKPFGPLAINILNFLCFFFFYDLLSNFWKILFVGMYTGAALQYFFTKYGIYEKLREGLKRMHFEISGGQISGGLRDLMPSASVVRLFLYILCCMIIYTVAFHIFIDDIRKAVERRHTKVQNTRHSEEEQDIEGKNAINPFIKLFTIISLLFYISGITVDLIMLKIYNEEGVFYKMSRACLRIPAKLIDRSAKVLRVAEKLIHLGGKTIYPLLPLALYLSILLALQYYKMKKEQALTSDATSARPEMADNQEYRSLFGPVAPADDYLSEINPSVFNELQQKIKSWNENDRQHIMIIDYQSD